MGFQSLGIPTGVFVGLLFCVHAQSYAADVQIRFSSTVTTGTLFPADNGFTVVDSSQKTKLRVSLPVPALPNGVECTATARASICLHIDNTKLLNRLDGFNTQPRISIPFTGPIDLRSVSNAAVFLIKLCKLQSNGSCPIASSKVGINQAVWDPDTNTLSAESDEYLDQASRYAVIVTNGVQYFDANGAIKPIGTSAYLTWLAGFPSTSSYRGQLTTAATEAAKYSSAPIAGISVFTTMSTTAVMEKIRDYVKVTLGNSRVNAADTVDFNIADGNTPAVYSFDAIAAEGVQSTAAARLRQPLSFSENPSYFRSLASVPNAVGTLAFGKFLSAEFRTTPDGGIINAGGTASGSVQPFVLPIVLYVNFVLPKETATCRRPFKVAIFGHGIEINDKQHAFNVAAKMAEKCFATVALNVPGHGGVSSDTLTIKRKNGSIATIPAGGRQTSAETLYLTAFRAGSRTKAPNELRAYSDALNQTVADLMQLVRQIKLGISITAAGADLDAASIYYFGQSLGGIYGTQFAALDSDVKAAVLNVAGGSLIDTGRLSDTFRSLEINQTIADLGLVNDFKPNWDQATQTMTHLSTAGAWDEFLPFRTTDGSTPVLELPRGSKASPIQELIERFEWAGQSASPVAYAPSLVAQQKRVLFQFADGDQMVPNPATTAIVRAGGKVGMACPASTSNKYCLTANTSVFHTLIGYGPLAYGGVGVPPDFLSAHLHLTNGIGATQSDSKVLETLPGVSGGNTAGNVGQAIAKIAQDQIAAFFTSGGASIIDPDNGFRLSDGSVVNLPYFQYPITDAQLPETKGY